VCRVAAQRPHLDGELNEPLWQHAEAVPLSSSANGETWDSQLRLAYDEEFLYLAIRSEKAEHADYAHDDTPRRYDADLSGRDRLRLCLDVDRDYVTYYELTLDHRGWTGDACWQSAAWNPRWY